MTRGIIPLKEQGFSIMPQALPGRVLYVCCVAALLWSQSFALDNSELKAYSKFFPGMQNDNEIRQPESQPDNSIVPEAYFIGGGDVFQISVVESPSIQYTGTVNENCDVYIPELGVIKIGKTSLAQAKKLVADFVSSKLRKKFDIYVSLVKTKTVVVSVTGAVSNPGTVRCPGTSRLFDALKAANNNTIPPYGEYDYRAVECLNRDSVKTYDVLKYLFVNNLAENPYVYPGDNIRLSLAQRRVFVSGAVRLQSGGWIPIKQGEQAADLLSLFRLDASADSDHIIIERTNPDNSALTKVVSLREQFSFPLADHDLVIVSEKMNYPQVAVIEVKGEVARPGNYPFVKNGSTAADILSQAGGATNAASSDRTYVIRRKRMFEEEQQQNFNPLKPVVPSTLFDYSVRPEVNSGISRMNVSNDYTVFRLSDNPSGIKLWPATKSWFRRRNCTYT